MSENWVREKYLKKYKTSKKSSRIATTLRMKFRVFLKSCPKSAFHAWTMNKKNVFECVCFGVFPETVCFFQPITLLREDFPRALVWLVGKQSQRWRVCWCLVPACLTCEWVSGGRSERKEWGVRGRGKYFMQIGEVFLVRHIFFFRRRENQRKIIIQVQFTEFFTGRGRKEVKGFWKRKKNKCKRTQCGIPWNWAIQVKSKSSGKLEASQSLR